MSPVETTTLLDSACLRQQVLETGVDWMLSVLQLSTLCNHYNDVIIINTRTPSFLHAQIYTLIGFPKLIQKFLLCLALFLVN